MHDGKALDLKHSKMLEVKTPAVREVMLVPQHLETDVLWNGTRALRLLTAISAQRSAPDREEYC
jgi:hypothetical protein